MIKKISLLLIVLITITLGCERDDICAEATATTPHLIIRFHDASNITATKTVRSLSVIGEGNSTNIVFNTVTDSIVLPLRFQNEGEITTTRFELKKDTDYDTDTDVNTNSNTDIIEVVYTPQFIYVSRACGYKSIFNDASLDIESDTNNWIINRDILNTTIDNENAAHINIYH